MNVPRQRRYPYRPIRRRLIDDQIAIRERNREMAVRVGGIGGLKFSAAQVNSFLGGSSGTR